MRLSEKLLAEASERIDLPVDALAGVPRMELIGSREFSMEPHGGLREYSKDRIVIQSRIGPVCVTGSGLNIRLMNQERLVIGGNVSGVCLAEEPGE